MSVGFYKMSPELVGLGGHAEANWLKAHMQNDDVSEYCTKFYITEDNIKDAVQSAKTCEAKKCKDCATSTLCECTLEEHKEITKKLPKELRNMLRAEEKKTEHEWFDLEVLW